MSSQAPSKQTGNSKPPVKPVVAGEEPQLLQLESVRWLLAIACSLLVYTLAAMVLQQVYHPDIDPIINEANRVLFEGGTVRPEPMEAALFRLAVITVIPGLFGFYALLAKGRVVAACARRPVYFALALLALLSLAALIFFDFAALNPFGSNNGDHPQNVRDLAAGTNFAFYFDGIFTATYWWAYLFIVVPALAALFMLGIRRYQWEENRVFRLTVAMSGYAVAGFGVLTAVLMNIYDFPYTNENKYDFNAVYQSITQVCAGVPMLVDGFTNTYGLYPHFLNPLFHIIGLSVFKCSLVMSVLLGVCFVLNLLLLRKFVANKVILFLGFAAVLFFPYLDFRILTIFDSLFSLFPIRYIIPCILTALAPVYFARRSAVVYWTTFAVMAMSVLWNPEIGMVCYLSWFIAVIYYDFYDGGRINIKQISKHLVVAAAMIVAIFYGYKLLIFAFYGSWPQLSLLFSTMFYFGRLGLGNLPMALVHPWNISALIVMTGFLYALVPFHKKAVSVKSTVILLVSLISLGYLFYFQGRSHDSNFALSSSYTIILLTLLGDELWRVVRNSTDLLLNGLFVVVLLLLSFSFIEVVFNAGKLVDLVIQEDNKDKQLPEQKRYDANTDYILRNSQPGQKIIVLSPKKRQALFFDGKRRSGFNPGFIDMFLSSDLTRLEHTLRDSSFSVFIEPSPGIYTFLTRPLAAFACSYQFTSYNQMMGLFNKRRVLMPERTFFTDSNKLIIHRKYTDDTGGRAMRINDATGTAPVVLNPEFSVEFLFYSTFQIFENATIVGNIQDTMGFAVANVINTPKYFFDINRTTVVVPMPYKEWSYCVMNVFADHCDVYRNGVLAASRLLPKPVDQSTNMLFVGNMNGFHYYVGGIAEVAVANKTVDTARIQHNWQEIKRELMIK